MMISSKMLGPLQSGRVVQFVCKYDSPLVVRWLSLSSPIAKSKEVFEATRSARMLKKIMLGTKHISRKPDNHHHPSKHLTDFGFMKRSGTSGYKPVSGRLMRRVDMLNNLFIEQITSLLATGEVSPEFLGLGVQISKVKVTQDFSAVNVYWYATGTERDDVIDALLAKCAGHLRHELSQLRVIGIVPPIQFFRDRTFSKLQEVEMLLGKCKITVDTEYLNDKDNGNESEEDKFDDVKAKENLVDDDRMTHDILGVKHDFIMNEVKKAVQRRVERKRAQEEQQNLQISTITNAEGSVTEKGADAGGTPLEQEVESYRKRQFAFLKYLKQQQAEKSKELKRLSVEAKEQEFYNEERENRKRSQLFMRLDELDDGSDSDAEDEEKYIEAEETYYENLREGFK